MVNRRKAANVKVLAIEYLLENGNSNTGERN
jgi:hypothetical protein